MIALFLALQAVVPAPAVPPPPTPAVTPSPTPAVPPPPTPGVTPPSTPAAPAAAAATPTPTPTLGAIGQQELPAAGCAAFLWSAAGDRTLVAMASAMPARIRLAIDGQPAVDLGWTAGEGAATLGLSPRGVYRGGSVTATLDLVIAQRSDVAAGAVVPQGTLLIEIPGRDTLVLPVAGLVGCRT